MTDAPEPPSPDQATNETTNETTDQATNETTNEATNEATNEPARAVAPVETAVVSASGPPGKVRETGTCILLTIVTLGIYSLVWYYKTSEEMKRHTGNGIGGPIALLLAILVGIVMPFLSSNEVGHLYERRGQKPPVSALTGLWVLLLGWFFLVGAIVWFVKTNRALNDYWSSLDAG